MTPPDDPLRAARTKMEAIVKHAETWGDAGDGFLDDLRFVLAALQQPARSEGLAPDFECYCGAPDPGTDGVCRSCNGATYHIDPDAQQPARSEGLDAAIAEVEGLPFMDYEPDDLVSRAAVLEVLRRIKETP